MNKMIRLLFLFVGCFFIVSLYAQIKIKYPYVTYRSIPYCVIYKIETDKNFTKVSLLYKNPYPMGWVNFSRTITLKDLGRSKTYNIIYTEGVPLSPQKKEFELIGEGVYCSLFFPPIPNDSKYIEINENVEGGFHFVFQLKSDIKRYSSQCDVMNAYIKKKWEEETLRKKKVELEIKQREKQREIDKQNSIKNRHIKRKKVLVKDPDFKID